MKKMNKKLTLKDFSITDIGNRKNLKRIIQDEEFGFNSAIEFMKEIAHCMKPSVGLLPPGSLEIYHNGLNKAIKAKTWGYVIRRSSYTSSSNKLYNKLIEGETTK